MSQAASSEVGEVKLIGAWQSPFVTRVQIALNIKVVAYEFLPEPEEFGKKSELLLKSNPVHKKIPVLLHHGKPICESMVIVQYIDEAWASSGPSILPPHPLDRAYARFWVEYIDSMLPHLNRTMLGLEQGDKQEAYEQVLALLQLLENAFEECSRGKQFFGGERLGYLDIGLGSFLFWLKAQERISGFRVFDELKTPRLVAWARRFCSDDYVTDVMPDVDKLVELAVNVHPRLMARGPTHQ